MTSDQPPQDSPEAVIAEFDRLIRRDPARRGLISSEPLSGPLCPGDLWSAARELSQNGRRVGILTGFFIPHGSPPAAETDGPPGAVLLALALQAAGMEAFVISDERCIGAVLAAAEAAGLSRDSVRCCPPGDPAARKQLLAGDGTASVSHLISIERVGPAHSEDSLSVRPDCRPETLSQFLSLVPAESHGRCFNMRGVSIDEYSADLHLLFDELPLCCPEARTIGIGDGGNEIGMGRIAWDVLSARIPGPAAAVIPCRIATDWTIIAGTSNWGGFALAAAVLYLKQLQSVAAGWDADFHFRLLEAMVWQGPAVDGVTGQQESSVDGLPFLTWIQPWEAMYRMLGH